MRAITSLLTGGNVTLLRTSSFLPISVPYPFTSVYLHPFVSLSHERISKGLSLVTSSQLYHICHPGGVR